MSDDIRKGQSSLDLLEENSEPQVGGVDHSRRKFAKAGVVAVPVIMTLASRPAMGNYGGSSGGGKCALSGMLSGNLSKPDDGTVCHGCTPGYWKTHQEQWGQTGCTPGKIDWVSDYDKTKPKIIWGDYDATHFDHVFGSGSDHDGESCMNVLWMTGHEDGYQLGAHAFAAYCNSKTDLNYGVSAWEVVDKYQKAMAGTYTNYYTEQGESDCRKALKMEFEALNQRLCPDGDRDPNFDFYDQGHWHNDAYNDWNDYRLNKGKKDGWSSHQDCKSWDEYKSWKTSSGHH